MKVVLEQALDKDAKPPALIRPRDIEIVGVKFCEYDNVGWLSVWMTDDNGGEMPVDKWILHEDAATGRVQAWRTDEDIEEDNWVYQCYRATVMEDD